MPDIIMTDVSVQTDYDCLGSKSKYDCYPISLHYCYTMNF